MYKLLASLFISTALSSVCLAQIDPKGSFEQLDPKTQKPLGWNYGFAKTLKPGYSVRLDSLEKKEGKYSLLIEKLGDAESYTTIGYSLPKSYDGKILSLVGYIKTEAVAKGFAGLWLRLDAEDGKSLGLENMEKEGIVGSSDWKKYSIELPYNKDAKTIQIGGLLVGDGKAWFDDLELFVDGNSVKTLKPSILFKAELDNEFREGSGITAFTPTEQQITNLAVAGQFWGFLKYHHFAIAKGEYNWDAELFRFLPSVIAAKNNAELSKALEDYLKKLPIPDLCKSCNAKTLTATQKPNYGDLMNGKILSPSITTKLIYILKNSNIKDNYFVAMSPGVGNPIFKNEKAYVEMKYPDAGYRILSLYRYWNMINYYFPYKYQIDGDWNRMIYDFIPQFIAAKDDLSYHIAALKLIANISDTHANIWNSNSVLDRFKGMNITPFKAKFIENKLVVTGFYTDTLNVKNVVKIGDEIVTINGKTVADLVKQFLPMTPASNYNTQLRDLPNAFLLRTNNKSLALSFKNEKGNFAYDVPMVGLRTSYKNIEYTKPTGFHLLNEQIGYIYPGKYKNTDMTEIKKLFQNTKGIVVDMRCYPTDFMPFTFGSYIKGDKTPFVKFTSGSVSNPGVFVMGEDLSNGGEKDSYKGKIIVIVNADSQSQAEYTTMAFQSSPNVKVLGNQTAGADGNVSSIILPGGISSWISGIGVFYPDGTPTQRVGVKIDYPMNPTIKGIAEGKDELLERAVALLENDH
jgi:C-terminal processing protease CtpA/Prc